MPPPSHSPLGPHTAMADAPARPSRRNRPPAPPTEALFDAAALAAAGVLDAPFGFLSLGETEVVRVVGSDWWTRQWLDTRPGTPDGVARLVRGSRAPIDIKDVQAHDAGHALGSRVVDGLRSFTAIPLRLADNTVVGHVGAMDIIERSWTTRQKEGLAGVARLSAAQLEGLMAASDTGDLLHIGRHLADGLAALETALAPLLDRADGHDDAVLQRQVAGVRSHLADVRLGRDHLEGSVARAGAAAGQVDLGEIVVSAVEEVERTTPPGIVAVPRQPPSLPVSADRSRTHAAVKELVEVAVTKHGGSTVAVRLRRHEVSSHAIDGTIAAELEVVVHGQFEPGDLARVAASFSRAHGLAQGTTSVRFEGDEVSLTSAGLVATTSPLHTRVMVRWPLDLG